MLGSRPVPRRAPILLALLVSFACGSACGASGAGVHETGDAQSADAFWRWFTRNADRIAMAKPRDILQEEPFHDELRRVHPGLTFDLPEALVGGERVLVISAGGHRGAFPAVEHLVAAAPAIPGWRVIAFRPPVPDVDGFAVRTGESRLDADRIRYDSQSGEAGLGITLYLPGYLRGDQRLPDAALVILERLLGERDLGLEIGRVDFSPSSEAPAGARPLIELRDELARRKQKKE